MKKLITCKESTCRYLEKRGRRKNWCAHLKISMTIGSYACGACEPKTKEGDELCPKQNYTS